MSNLIQRIFEVNHDVRQGTRTSKRENDMLTKHSETRSTLVTLEEPVLFLETSIRGRVFHLLEPLEG
jgi:hypothetical protein